MRITSIITSFTTGGAEMLACNLTEAFTTAGHTASVLALSDAAQVGNPTDIEQQMLTRVTETGALARSLARKNRNNWIGGAKALRRTLRVIKPDIIHAHTVRALPWIALARPGVPVILTHHNSRLPFHPRAFRVFDQLVFTYVAISDRCEAQMAGYARRPIRKILNAASPRFTASAPRVAPARNPIILAVGTISEQKDYPTLIRAAVPLVQMLAEHGRKPDIRIAGGGETIGDLEQLVRQLGMTEYVTLLGPRNDVDTLMQQADIFVNCSLWEGFPIALIEASMSGLPIVATQIEGNCEMVIPGANGELVPPSNPLALAQAIAAAVGNDASYAAMSQASLETARRFSIDTCAAAHLALYTDAVVQPWHPTPDSYWPRPTLQRAKP